MADFDCSKPADGTPLLTCCGVPPGNLVECQDKITKAVVYQQQFFLHAPSCTMYRRMDAKVSKTFQSGETRDRIDTTIYEWRSSQLTNSVSSTTLIPLYADSISCFNAPYVRRINDSCLPGSESFTVQCYSDTSPPGSIPGYDYTTTFSLPFTRNDMLGPLNELLTYMGQNFDTAPTVVGFRPGGEIGPAQFAPNGPSCTSDSGNGQNWNETYGAMGGLENNIDTELKVGYVNTVQSPFGAVMPTESACYRIGTITWVAWFSKVTLTQNYQIETFAVRSLDPPPLCPQLAPMKAVSSNVCDLVATQQFSDGLNDNNGQRIVLFGPRDYTPHYTRTLCRA